MHKRRERLYTKSAISHIGTTAHFAALVDMKSIFLKLNLILVAKLRKKRERKLSGGDILDYKSVHENLGEA